MRKLPSVLLAVSLCTVDSLSAAAPRLYAQPGYESPVRASGDDLLLLSGIDLSASDTIVYQALSDTRSLPAHPAAVPASSTAASGVADIASAANAPYSLAVRLPNVITQDQSYVLWVRSAGGEWSNGVRINDARPLWITPDYVYSTATVAGLPRVLKVVGRNLAPAPGALTVVRLSGPRTYTLLAKKVPAPAPLNQTTQLQRYVAVATLPIVITPGTYSIEVRRDASSFTPLIGYGSSAQTLTVLPDPVAAPEFSVSDPLYGVGSDFRFGQSGVACQPDDAAEDTPCILNAIEAAKRGGGGTIVFGAGTWDLPTSLTHGTFGGIPGDGIVVPPNVNLRGAGATATTIVRGAEWSRGAATFTLQGPSTVSGFTFRDATIYQPGDYAGAMLALGVKWYWVNNYGTPVTHTSNVVITDNVFDKPFFAITDGGLPIDHLFVTNNTFGGAYDTAIAIGGDGNDTVDTFAFSDSVVAYNTFFPSSYTNPSIGQGSIATQLGSGRHIDFSNNSADGTSTRYFYDAADQKGFRAAYFWSTGQNQDMVLVSRNTALCSGDKVGDGEAIVFDGSAQNEAFPAAQPAIAAAPWSDANGNPGTSVTVLGSVRTTRNVYGVAQPIADLNQYYAGSWLRIVKGPGLGQWRRVLSLGADSGSVTVNVTPPLDVLPEANSLVLVGRGSWQTAIIDNYVDQRRPTCTKGNITRPTGGTLSWYSSTADSAMEGNQQYDTNGIIVAHQYKEVEADTPEPFTMTQSSNEVRGNRVDGEYDWSSTNSSSGILLGYAATPDTGPPPVISYGVTVAHNTIRQADTSRGSTPIGAISLVPGWWTGPHDAQNRNQWQMAASTLVFHNALSDINGGSFARVGIGLDSAFPDNRVAWESVLYANSCSNVQTALADYGIATVRYCPTAASSCECSAPALDLAISASSDVAEATLGDTLEYTAHLSNASSASASGVTVTLEPSAEIAVSSIAASQGTCDLPTRVCKLGSLAPSGVATITVSATAARAGSASLIFSLTHGEPDPVVANDVALVALDIE